MPQKNQLQSCHLWRALCFLSKYEIMSVFREIRCPHETCYGWVSEVEESKNKYILGCGNCGNIWIGRSELYAAILTITKKYPYRASVYIASTEGYSPVDLDEEPEDYVELVVTEFDNM
jgi:hypothetical protein